MVKKHEDVLEKIKAGHSKALDALSDEMATALEQARVKAEENKAAQTRLEEENERLKTRLQVSFAILVLVPWIAQGKNQLAFDAFRVFMWETKHYVTPEHLTGAEPGKWFDSKKNTYTYDTNESLYT